MMLVHRCSAPSLVLVAALGAAYVGAQQTQQGAVPECAEAHPHAPTPPPIMTLRTREFEVAVYGGDELGFTVLDLHGLVLAERIDEDTFADRFPALHRQLDSAFASDGSQLSPPWADATVRTPRDGSVDAGL